MRIPALSGAIASMLSVGLALQLQPIINSLECRVCTANACIQAITALGSADCSAFFATTTITPTTTSMTTTTTELPILTVARRSDPSALPSYASACTIDGQYASACSCLIGPVTPTVTITPETTSSSTTADVTTTSDTTTITTTSTTTTDTTTTTSTITTDTTTTDTTTTTTTTSAAATTTAAGPCSDSSALAAASLALTNLVSFDGSPSTTGVLALLNSIGITTLIGGEINVSPVSSVQAFAAILEDINLLANCGVSVPFGLEVCDESESIGSLVQCLFGTINGGGF